MHRNQINFPSGNKLLKIPSGNKFAYIPFQKAHDIKFIMYAFMSYFRNKDSNYCLFFRFNCVKVMRKSTNSERVSQYKLLFFGFIHNKPQ